ncbi:TMEM175 family protein [Acinetobacter shaoyimingii]|uniref:DUF1211 domain-containing protein n=1 Tax=Acinetobacter shaoyimingii TaxID=2715164 RepID=A0A6G8RXE8_9GAMM|nr:TMEM175 family protein [Acinetobacter shaoyimingii]NHB57949.1 DUF1211 domain-containing protein [Acinetobacter shaoyimingii]QIO06545.1 DUF1211 domain-containing protein [Acinetobacter shaoyimingii]
MNKLRLETISDGLFSIIITVMLLELKIPEGNDFLALHQELHLIFSYVLSFIYVGIYWNNHHHLFQVVKSVNGKTLWVNLHLMFWLTMIPFATGWSGQSNYAAVPTAVYAFVLFMSSLSYRLLEKVLIHDEGHHSLLVELLVEDNKLMISNILYAAAIFLSFLNTKLALLTLGILAAFWFIPNRSIEKYFKDSEGKT